MQSDLFICNAPSPPNSIDGSRAYRTAEFDGWVPGGQEDACRVPMQLLKEPKQEENGEYG